MAQLPDSEVNNNNNNSLMDEIKVNPESKQTVIDENDFCDNDSLQNHADSHDYNDNNRHAIIQNRDPAPEPPSSLTMALLQHHDNENPPQSMLAGTNTSNPITNLGLSNIMNTNNNVPDMLIQPLIEMGFTRAKAIYALQQSENIMGSMSVDYAVSWLFEHPNFIPPDTTNITNTIGNMLGNDFLGGLIPNTNNKNINPPNNSPNHNSNNNDNNNNNNNNNINNNNNTDTNINTNNNGDRNDDFALYNLIENLGTNDNNNNSKSKSNRIYSRNETIGSAATHEMDEKTDKINGIRHNDNNTSSTVASELSVLSTIETSQTTINNNNNTKETISQLYIQQHAKDIINKNNITENMIPKDLKMVIIVRKDLKMSSGKVAAQCCHACLGVVMDIINMQYTNTNTNTNNNNNNNSGSDNGYDLKLILRLWRMNGEKKIILQCLNEKNLLELKDKALINNLPHYLVCDAGHTQVKHGTKTVLAIGPFPSIHIDKITKELKLY